MSNLFGIVLVIPVPPTDIGKVPLNNSSFIMEGAKWVVVNVPVAIAAESMLFWLKCWVIRVLAVKSVDGMD